MSSQKVFPQLLGNVGEQRETSGSEQVLQQSDHLVIDDGPAGDVVLYELPNAVRIETRSQLARNGGPVLGAGDLFAVISRTLVPVRRPKVFLRDASGGQ
ncbi:hypothetical protein [Arthrobacter sp. GAS37]|uniref:hypothetical protein n=1 Tax=Arthrobacter sp. GAS37 TaxID=3156261 RepID=UPI00384B04EF